LINPGKGDNSSVQTMFSGNGRAVNYVSFANRIKYIMILKALFSKSPEESQAAGLYGRIVDQARHPVFYERFGVPDSLDGRFEMIALHAFLVLRRLKDDHPRGAVLGQSLHDLFFADMDQCLREMGAGDLGVGKRVKRMAEGFHGRVAAYESALTSGSSELEEALRRNVYGTAEIVPPDAVSAMAAYARAQSASLAQQSFDSIAAGQIRFDEPRPNF